jgi:hypothetical protein
MASQLSINTAKLASFVFPNKGKSLSGAPTRAKAVDLHGKFPGHMGVRNTKEFISDVGGRRTRWPLVVGASLLGVCLIAYAASGIMFKGTLSGSSAVKQNGSAGAEIVPENGAPAAKSQSSRRSASESEKPGKAFAFSFQAGAEAAQETDFPMDIDSARYSKNLDEAKSQQFYEQVSELLKSTSEALKSEDLESFMAHLDDSEPGFVRQQELKAKFAFRRFDNIDGTYSDIKIEVLSDNELAVSLRCKVDAAFTKSGRSIVLFNGDQSLILRKTPGAEWKICAIEKG